MASRLQARLLLIDDARGRQLAQRLGLPIRGTLGILVVAKRAGLLSAIAPSLDRLRDTGMRVAPRSVELALNAAGDSTK